MLKYKYLKIYFKSGCGREIGIRTPGGFHTSTVFKTAAFDRSAISRKKICDYNQNYLNLAISLGFFFYVRCTAIYFLLRPLRGIIGVFFDAVPSIRTTYKK